MLCAGDPHVGAVEGQVSRPRLSDIEAALAAPYGWLTRRDEQEALSAAVRAVLDLCDEADHIGLNSIPVDILRRAIAEHIDIEEGKK